MVERFGDLKNEMIKIVITYSPVVGVQKCIGTYKVYITNISGFKEELTLDI